MGICCSTFNGSGESPDEAVNALKIIMHNKCNVFEFYEIAYGHRYIICVRYEYLKKEYDSRIHVYKGLMCHDNLWYAYV